MTTSPAAELISNTFGDTCLIYPFSSNDSRGQPQYGTSRIVSCRVQHAMQKAFKPDGEVGTIKTTLVFISGGDSIAFKDKVVLNDVEGIVQLNGVLDHVHDRDGNVLFKEVRF